MFILSWIRARVLPRIPRWILLTLPRWLLVLWGARLLWRISVAAFGGHDKLWRFQHMEAHRFTAMSILTGTLRLRNGLAKVAHDEQLYNGASYTNWGFGVPLLQAPFHALAARMPGSFPSKFFPDRAIFFFYFALCVPVVWLAFDRLLAMRQPQGSQLMRRHVLSWAGVLMAITCALFPLMSCRFIIYEETISYLIIFELLALSAYIFALRSWGSGAVCMMGIASGIGLMVRPTGLICLGVWAVLVVLEARRPKPVIVFLVSAAPFVGLWMFTNWVRTGSAFGLGYNNALPSYPYHVPMLRFGSHCADTREHTIQVAKRLFQAFFVPSAEEAWPWLRRCHLDFESRPPAGQPYFSAPFFGVTVLAVLAWMSFHHLARRDRRLADFVPFAALLFLFANFVHAAAGFAWRYEGDFWPFILLACVQYVHRLPRGANPLLGWPLALVFIGCSAVGYYGYVAPALTTLEVVDEKSEAGMWDQFTNSRYSGDPPIPSRLSCGDNMTWPLNNGLGWYGSACAVDTFTNVYLGVRPKRDDDYVLQFGAVGIGSPTLTVYVNGRSYKAYRSGDTYRAHVRIHYDWLTSPIVVVTIEWTSDMDAPPGVRMTSVELL